MRIAILSDIHANREAFEACLLDAGRHGAQRFVLLGDIVGYGADPAWAVGQAQALVEAGAIAIKGNHDEAAADATGGMTADAGAAIAWTGSVLDAQQKAFLRALPFEVEEEDRLYVHANAVAPTRWAYVQDAEDARRSLDAVTTRIVLCGHLHIPALYGLTATAKLASFRPVGSVAVPLTRPRRWLAVLGAVGQPRDGEPAAAWSMLDATENTLTLHRVPYDVETAARKIRAAGLPEALATRLFRGR
jgi:diadenosine tetraphosphatase ApaH/serine/threonine PP2A family protein phosphatase